MTPKCEKCGGVVDRTTCTACGEPAETVTFKLTADAPIITVGRGPTSSSRDTVIRVAAPGASSEARISEAGDMSVTVAGVGGVGRSGEGRVATMLCIRFGKDGRAARFLADGAAKDDRGEDRILEVDGRRYSLQIMTAPGSKDFWQAASVSSASTSVPPSHSIEWLEQCVQRKSHMGRRNVVLALDALHFATLAAPGIVQDYLDRYGDPASRFGFAAVWVVGPTYLQCSRLGSGTV